MTTEKTDQLCANAQHSVYFGCWNVRSCAHYWKQQLTCKQLQKYNLQICEVCETNIYDSETKLIGDYTPIYSGLSKERKTRSAFGVGI
jgi:hypothetical protein